MSCDHQGGNPVRGKPARAWRRSLRRTQVRLGLVTALLVGALLVGAFLQPGVAARAAGSQPHGHPRAASAAPVVSAQTVTYRFQLAVRHLRAHRQTHQSTYDRDADFGDWIDQGAGCDTRAVVLEDESQVATTQNDYCTVQSGRWLSYYDGQTYTDPTDLQVDHVVPVANAWASGAWRWSQGTRVRYYNDLTDSRTLVAVDAHDNEAKSDQTPDEWLPPVGDCRYARDFTSIKLRWQLTVTRPEKRALTRLAATCPDRPIRYVPAPVRIRDRVNEAGSPAPVRSNAVPTAGLLRLPVTSRQG